MKGYQKKTIKTYDETVDKYIKSTRDLQDKEWITSFSSFLPSKGRILDVGCAFGRDCRDFAEKGFDVRGIDFSENMIKKARELVPKVQFHIMDVQHLEFEDEYFDGVWASLVLIHLKKEDIPEALEEIRRVLKKGGVLYLNMKDGEGEELIKDSRYSRREKFFSYFKKEELVELLSKQGFKTLEVKLKRPKSTYGYILKINLIAQKV